MLNSHSRLVDTGTPLGDRISSNQYNMKLKKYNKTYGRALMAHTALTPFYDPCLTDAIRTLKQQCRFEEQVFVVFSLRRTRFPCDISRFEHLRSDPLGLTVQSC